MVPRPPIKPHARCTRSASVAALSFKFEQSVRASHAEDVGPAGTADSSSVASSR